MDFKDAIDIVIKDIDDLEDIIGDFKNYPGVPPLEVEIAKSKCRHAVELLKLVESLEPKTVETAIPIVESPKKEYFDIEEPEPDSKVGPVSGATESAVKILVSEKDRETASVGKLEEMELIHKQMKHPKPESAIMAETFNPNTDSIYDKMGSKNRPEISKARKTTNLFEAIGINDKFLFIREIFNGDSDLYNTAISRLNNAATFEEAHKIILDYVDDREDEAYQTLVELVNRKFVVNG